MARLAEGSTLPAISLLLMASRIHAMSIIPRAPMTVVQQEQSSWTDTKSWAGNNIIIIGMVVGVVVLIAWGLLRRRRNKNRETEDAANHLREARIKSGADADAAQVKADKQTSLTALSMFNAAFSRFKPR